MSWRDLLGVTNFTHESLTQSTHNTQKPPEPGNCAYSAGGDSKLFEDLADACRGLPIAPSNLRAVLSPEDIEDWRKGNVSAETLAAFARMLVQRREREAGRVPEGWSERAVCARCGPVWLWFAGEVLGCPWCWNRAAGRPIPRPHAVRCGDCQHFERIDHPNLGHCVQGEPEALAGLWDTARRGCVRWLPSEQNGRGTPHGG